MASYKYVTYTMKITEIKLSTNLFVASVMNLTVYSLAIFSWFLHTFINSEPTFFSGLQVGFWLFITSEIALLTTILYKYRKEEVIHGMKTILKFIKKPLKRMKKLQKT